MMRAYLRPFLMLLLLGLIGASGFRAEAQENPHKTPIFKPMLQAQTVNAIAWSPSGVELALFASNGVFIYDRNAQLLRHSDFAAASGGWSDDGKELIVDNHIMDSKTLTLLFDYELPFHTWLNKGSQVLTIAKDGRGIQIWDTKNGSLIKTILSPAQLEYLSPSPDGDRILAVIANSIFIFDAKKGNL